MIKQHFSIDIHAPVQKVREIMLSDDWYRKRTNAFNPAWSRFEGDRSEGSKIRFLWPNPEDPTKIGWMFSEIAQNRPYEFVSIRHLGEIDGETVKENPEWKWILENYSFSEENGITTVSVEIDEVESFVEYMEQMRPKALASLKELCEKE